MEIKTFLQNFADMLDDTDATLIVENAIFRDLDEWDSLTALEKSEIFPRRYFYPS